MIIVIDGLDASGKTTQTKMLVERLEKMGLSVRTLDFPQYENNVYGVILKHFLANDYCDSVDLDPKLSALLFAGDRYESKSSLDEWNANSIVILNRYTPSNIAYNRAKAVNALEADKIERFINALEYNLLELPVPDKVIVLGSCAAITKARLQNETDGYESNSTFLDKVAQEYVKLCDTEPTWEFLPITLEETVESVHERIMAVVMRLLE